MKKLGQILISIVCISLVPIVLFAHSGRTDSNGGHYNRKTGEYHYHNSGSRSTSSGSSSDGSSYQPSVETTPEIEEVEVKPATISITENHWQVALNNKVFKGQLEVAVSTGRVDILTEKLVIEVDKVSKFQEGVKQALKYAEATGKNPTLALYIDGEKKGYELYQKAESLCKEKGVSLILINSYVSVNDLINLVNTATSTAPEYASELNYWLNTKSGVRHNSSCRYYMNTSGGRRCTKSEGRACSMCGG